MAGSEDPEYETGPLTAMAELARYSMGLARLEIELMFSAIADVMPGISKAGDAGRLRSGWMNGVKRLGQLPLTRPGGPADRPARSGQSARSRAGQRPPVIPARVGQAGVGQAGVLATTHMEKYWEPPP